MDGLRGRDSSVIWCSKVFCVYNFMYGHVEYIFIIKQVQSSTYLGCVVSECRDFSVDSARWTRVFWVRIKRYTRQPHDQLKNPHPKHPNGV